MTPQPFDAVRLVGPLLLLAIGLGMLCWTWGTWPDPLVDFGRELYVPWRLTRGDTLFADIAWFNGPLSAYVNALLFKVFGPGLSVLVWSNALVLAAVVAMLYGWVARLSDRLTATVAGMVVLLVFGVGQYVGIANYNWITPYSHDATHGAALALAALTGIERWHRTRSSTALWLGALALGLCFLTKVEAFVAGAAGCAVLISGAGRRADARPLVGALVVALAPVGASVVLVGADGTVGAWRPLLTTEVASLPFYLGVTGLDLPGARLLDMLRSAGLWLVALAPILVIARLSASRRGTSVPLATAAGLLLTLVLIGDRIDWPAALRPLPLFVIVTGGLLCWRGHRDEGRRRPIAAIAFAAFGLALLAKVLLNVRAGHYGFVLAMPAMALLVTALVGWLPAWLDEHGARGDVVRAGALALITIFVLEHMSLTSLFLAQKTEAVGSGRDAFRADVRGMVVNQALDRIASLGATSLAVVPEGVMINYLARVPNPTPYVNFMPPEEILFGDDAWTEAFRNQPPEVILFVPKDTSEYGRGAFAVGYARALGAWIASEYVLLDVIRNENLPFEVRILVRRSAASA